MIHPNGDQRTLDLCERLYDEELGDRKINIDFDSESTLPLNGFAKNFGLEPESTLLLTVFVNEESADFERLWAIYRGWLHDGMTPEAALAAKAR